MVYLIILLKLIVGFISLLIVMRLLGKKELSQVTPFDIIYSVVFGGILEESLYDSKISISQLLFAVFSWGAIIYFVEVMTTKSQHVRTFFKGKPAYLIMDGKINFKEMKKNKIEMEQVRSLLRMQGIFTVKEVKYMILETGGQVSVMKHDKYELPNKSDLSLSSQAPVINYLLIDNGKIIKSELKALRRDSKWLLQKIQEKGYKNIEDIVYAEWNEKEGIYIKPFVEIEQREIK